MLAAVLVGTVDVVMWIVGLRAGMVLPAFGMDLHTYQEAARSFVAGTGFYQPYQLAGPYGLAGQPILYPPQAIPLFLVFGVLPDFVWWAFLWWAIPLGVLAYRLPRHGRLWVVLACLAWPQTVTLLWAGNPVIWMAAFFALGFSPLVLLKPTLAPFALIGVRNRRWWIGLGAMLVLTVAFLPMLPDYVTVLRNVQADNLFYQFASVPIMVVGWLSRGGEPAVR